jgi:glycosidase
MGSILCASKKLKTFKHMNNRVKKFTIVLAAFILFISCESRKEKSIVAWPMGVKYEVFVLSFADGNGDGKGDLKGLTSKLDYLHDLGVNGIWMMPIMQSPSYHKYDITNYRSIDPAYGTFDDFKKLVREAHKRDIKIILDLVINHTSVDHPWFQSAVKGKDSPYYDYYVWAEKDSIRKQLNEKKVLFDTDNLSQWHAVNNDTAREQYYGFFSDVMPDLNFANERLKEDITEIGRFWLQDMKVDGFRLDAARYIYPEDKAADSHAYWIEFRDKMREIKPDVYLVGEVWADYKSAAPYVKGLPAVFNFDMCFAITKAINSGKDSIGLVNKYKAINDYYKSLNPDYVDATFLRNHDQARILSELDNDKNKARLAASILLTLPGTPYIYYGEEIGMIGQKPDEYCREPFIWDVHENDPLQTTWETPRFSTDQTVVPLHKQKDDKNSIYEFYKQYIHYRNSSEALTYGSIERVNIQMKQVICFTRKYDEDELLILHNLSLGDVVVSLKDIDTKFDAIDYTTTGTAKLHDGQLTLPAYSTVILK